MKKILQHGIRQAYLFPHPHITGEENPPFFIKPRRHPGNQTIIPVNDHGEFCNILQEIFIGNDLQIMPVNIHGRHIIQLTDAALSHGFCNGHFLAQRFPPQSVIRPDTQLLPTKQDHCQPVRHRRTAQNELIGLLIAGVYRKQAAAQRCFLNRINDLFIHAGNGTKDHHIFIANHKVINELA